MNDLIKATTGRNLTKKQTAKLDRMAEADPTAVVTGWSNDFSGPFITDGAGVEKVLPVNGHLRNRQPGHQ